MLPVGYNAPKIKGARLKSTSCQNFSKHKNHRSSPTFLIGTNAHELVGPPAPSCSSNISLAASYPELSHLLQLSQAQSSLAVSKV